MFEFYRVFTKSMEEQKQYRRNTIGFRDSVKSHMDENGNHTYKIAKEFFSYNKYVRVTKHHFREESSFKTYLFKIGRNKALNALKRNRIYAELDTDIEDIEIDLPALDEQKRVVSILNAIDSKIESNREINNNLAA